MSRTSTVHPIRASSSNPHLNHFLAAHGHRSSNYSQYDYVGELGSLIDDMSQYSNLSIAQNLLLIPSVCQSHDTLPLRMFSVADKR